MKIVMNDKDKCRIKALSKSISEGKASKDDLIVKGDDTFTLKFTVKNTAKANTFLKYLTSKDTSTREEIIDTIGLEFEELEVFSAERKVIDDTIDLAKKSGKLLKSITDILN